MIVIDKKWIIFNKEPTLGDCSAELLIGPPFAMDIEQYMRSQSAERQTIMRDIHQIILELDPTVQPLVELMMGKEMVVYKCQRMMKYGLAAGKSYLSLHAMPIYGSPTLHARYKELLPNAHFQKGCINFADEAAMPLDVLRNLIAECARIDLRKIKEQYLQSRTGKT